MSDEKYHDFFKWFAIVLIFASFYTLYFKEFSLTIGLISVIIACVSIRLGIRSQWLGEQSKSISIDSANANFLNSLSSFEDKRLSLQYHPRKTTVHPIFIWKALIDLRIAEGLLDNSKIELQHQRRLINLLNHLIKYLSRYFIERLICEEVEHLLDMALIGLKVDDRLADKKNEMNGRIKQLFDEEDDVEINEEYIRFMIGAIEESHYRELFTTRRDRYKEQYRQQNT